MKTVKMRVLERGFRWVVRLWIGCRYCFSFDPWRRKARAGDLVVIPASE